MNTYHYSAKDENGRTVYGTFEAKDEADLQARLKLERKYLLSARRHAGKGTARRMRSDRVADFSRNIGKLVGAGVPLVRALRIVCDDETVRTKEREIFAGVLRLVRSGMSLSEALQEQGDVFPPMFINMYRSAEASGTLEATASQMAIYYDKEYKLNQKIKSSMTYPKILLVLIVAVVLIIMGYVVPRFQTLFSQMDTLPFATRVLLGVSRFVEHHLDVLIVFCIAVFMLGKLLMSIAKIRYRVDWIKVHMPLTGKLMRVIYTARFARTLASLYNAGIPIITCLTIARDTIDNTYIEKQFDRVAADVCSGRNLSEALGHVDGFTKKLVSSVVVGEETGALDSMLISIADQMEYDAEAAIGSLVSMLEPVMIVVMAVIVGFIMISIIQPIYGSYEAISNSGQW